MILGARGWPLIVGGGGLLERGWLFEELHISNYYYYTVLHISKNDFLLTMKVYYEILFFPLINSKLNSFFNFHTTN